MKVIQALGSKCAKKLSNSVKNSHACWDVVDGFCLISLQPEHTKRVTAYLIVKICWPSLEQPCQSIASYTSGTQFHLAAWRTITVIDAGVSCLVQNEQSSEQRPACHDVSACDLVASLWKSQFRW